MNEYREQIKTVWRQSPITEIAGSIAEEICKVIDACTDHQLTVLARRWKRLAKNETNGIAVLVARQFAEQLMAGKIPEKKPKQKAKRDTTKKILFLLKKYH